jgi:organic radical activating enzyme
MTELYNIEIPGGQGTMKVVKEEDRITIHRYATRGKIRNKVETYEVVNSDGRSELKPLSAESAKTILDRIKNGVSYASAFIFETVENDMIQVNMTKSDMEHKFTSTGIKFWRHTEQMVQYLEGKPGSIVSSHISPEGACNLKCPYCSVTYRDTHSRISLDVIQKYVEDLQTVGLKAIILTGGGEPTAYPDFNKLVQWLKYERKLAVALITNGTLTNRLESKSLAAFSWVRVSVNFFDGWEQRIALPTEHLSPDCVVGCSMVYTAEHEATTERVSDRLDLLKRVSGVADKLKADYVRILPNCLMEQRELLLQHRSIDRDLNDLGDARFFHQHKVHGTPRCGTCHQAYFRPYLSEEKFHETGEAGTVYPCDSIVLNNSYQHFAEIYQICHARDVLKFLGREIKMRFDPRVHCTGCVFTSNVHMLDDWKVHGISNFTESPVKHEEFV